MKSKKKFMILWVLLIAVLFAGSLLTAPPGKTETIQTAMRDAVLHEENQISLFGWKNVNPGLISAMTVSAILLIAAACIRVFVIPKFKLVPGRFQLLLEQAVSLFDGIVVFVFPRAVTGPEVHAHVTARHHGDKRKTAASNAAFALTTFSRPEREREIRPLMRALAGTGCDLFRLHFVMDEWLGFALDQDGAGNRFTGLSYLPELHGLSESLVRERNL